MKKSYSELIEDMDEIIKIVDNDKIITEEDNYILYCSARCLKDYLEEMEKENEI